MMVAQKNIRILKNFLRRVTILSLLISFVLSPFASFANSLSETNSAQNQNSVSQEQSPNNNSPTLPTKHEENLSNDNNLLGNKSLENQNNNASNDKSKQNTLKGTNTDGQTNTSSGSNPDITSDQKESAAIGTVVNPNSAISPGTFNYQFPITIPAGRNGQTPNITLQYSSESNSDTGFGYGWNSSIPFIERYNKQGFETMYSTTTPSTQFYSSMSGELATTSTAGQYMSRNDDGTNLQYTFGSSTWTVKDKLGTTYLFGSASTTRQDDIGGSGKIFKWMLEKQTDANGNSIIYTYAKDFGQIYPQSISYTNTATTTGIFAITFTKALLATTSTATSTMTGFLVSTRYRVTQIDVSINGTTNKQYLLNYRTGDNAVRPMLSTVTEKGINTFATITLPPNLFSYASSTISFATSTTYSLPKQFVAENYDQGVQLVDINGDGYADIVSSVYESSGSKVISHVYINTGSNWTESSTWIAPCSLQYGGTASNDVGARMEDLNGDGLPDFICNGGTVLINTGHSWERNSDWDLPTRIADNFGYDAGVRFGDVNGDGLPDLVQSVTDTHNGYNYHRVYINTGNGWVFNANWVVPGIFTSDYGRQGAAQLVDVNGDGLVDLVYSQGGHDVQINTGMGWQVDPAYQTPSDTDFANFSYRLYDINGDKLPDIVYSYSQLPPYPNPQVVENDRETYLNTGDGWKISSTTASAPFGFNAEESGARIGDVNGDGIPDIVVSGSGSVNNTWSINTVQLSQANHSDLLKTVQESTGKKETVTYKQTSQYRDASGNLLNPTLQFGFPTLQKLETFDGVNATSTQTYQYQNGSYYFGNSLDRRFAGFGLITATDPLGNISKTYYDTGIGTSTALGQSGDDQAKIGKVYRSELYDTSNFLYRTIVNRWSEIPYGGSNFVLLASTTELDYDGRKTHMDQAKDYAYTTPTNGDVATETSWGQVVANNDGSFADTGNDKRVISYTYAASSTAPMTSVNSKTLTDQSGTIFSKVKYYFDTLAFGSIGAGNPTETDSLKTGTTTFIKTDRKTYNMYGLVTSDIDPRNATTTFAYDTFGLYPTSVTNALGQVTSSLYNYFIGKPYQTQDLNGLITKTVFDTLNRAVALLRPDPLSPSNLATTTTFAYTDSTYPRQILETDYLNNATTTNKYSYIDGYGHTIEQRTQAEGSNTYAVQDMYYNGLGIVSSASLPYFVAGTSYTGVSSPPTASLLTNTSYDALGRPTTISNAVGSTFNSYGNWEVTTTDPNGNLKDYFKDAYGNLLAVVEHITTTTGVTSYIYDANNNLTKITDALGNIRNFTYDLLGRKLSAEDVHAPSDTTFGTWNYAYDDSGNTTQQVDPKSQTTNYTFDLVNRSLTEDYTGQTGTEVTYGYDTCTNGIGHLCTATTSAATTNYAYDLLGNTIQEAQTVSSTTYTTQRAYDRQGNVTNITYPDNSQVAYTYNSANLLDSIAQKESGASSYTSVVNNIDYSPTGKIALEQYANGVTTTNTYDPAKLYRLVRINTLASSGAGTLSMPGGGGSFDSVANGGDSDSNSEIYESTNHDDTDAIKLIFDSLDEIPVESQTIDSSTSSMDTSTPVASDDVATSTSSDDSSNTSTTSPAIIPIATTTPDGMLTSDHSLLISTTSQQTLGTTTLLTGSSSPSLSARLHALSADADELKLKAPKGDLLGNVALDDNIIKYAYKTTIAIESIPPSDATESTALKQGYTLTGEVVGLRTSNARTFATDHPGHYIQEISSGEPQYYKDDTGLWWLVKYGITTQEAFTAQTKPKLGIIGTILSYFLPSQAFADTQIFPIGGYDGELFKDDSQDWEITRTTGNATYGSYTESGNNIIDGYGNGRGSTYYSLRRAYMLFDTSSIPTISVVQNASLSLYVISSSGASTTKPIQLVSFTPGSYSSLGFGDFNNVGSTSFASMIGPFAINSYNSMTLNPSGMAYISRAGITGFALRTANDFFDYSPNATTSASMDFGSQEQTGEGPKLIVAYYIYSPTQPLALQANGFTNPTALGDHLPQLSAVFNDATSTNYAIGYQLQVATTSSNWATPVWDSDIASTTGTTTVGLRIPPITYGGSPLQAGTTYYWHIRFLDENYHLSDWSTETASFVIAPWYNPNAPTNLLVNSLTNPTNLSSSSPSFSALYTNTIATDTAASYQIQVSQSPGGWGNTFWDSTKQTLASSTPSGMQTGYLPYSGPTLSPSSTYYWRIRFWNSEDSVGNWSTTTASFALNQNLAVGDLQDIYYSYDNNGNITKITDLSGTGLGRTALYSYDNLNRLISSSITGSSTSPTGSWYNPSWTYRVPITASSTQVSADTGDVYMNLSELPSGVFTHAKTNGCDLRVTKSDGVTELPFELTNYSSSGSGQIFFSTGGALASTPTYYLYYGNSSASCYAINATYGAQNVYDSNTKGVWHLEQNTSSSGGILDSTANAHNGTMYSSYAPAANGVSGGIVGNGADFNGTNTSIDIPHSSDFLSSAFTAEGWLYMNQSPSTHGEDETAFAQKSSGNPYRAYGLAESSGSNSTSGNWYNPAGTGAYAGTYSGTTSSGAWHYVVLKHDPSQVGSELSVLTDGSTSGTYTASSTGAMFNADDVFRLGADYDGGARLDGAMDEVRFHNVALSTNYLQTRYKDMSNPWSFWSVGTESSGGGSTTASTTYTETYSYDLLGNLLSKTGTGNYAYAGNLGTSYANPHAPTTVGSSTLAYDNDGNLTSMASTTYAWDYRNRMTGTASSTYAYDFQNNRVKKVVGSTTTIYPNTLYSITGTSTITRNIYDTGGNLVQTTNGGSATTTAFVHPDILGSTNVTTDPSGHMAEAIDYYPYGAMHLDLGTLNTEPRKYIGQLSDSESGLNYLNARYQDPARGQFVSEDPVFWGQQNLIDPQSLNSYSYANDNPVTLKDPSGTCAGPFIEVAPVCIGVVYGIAEVKLTDPNAGLTQYAIGAVSGGIQGAVAEERAIVSGGITFASSITQDYSNHEVPNLTKATVAGLGAALGVSTLNTVSSGVSLMAVKSGSSLAKSEASNVAISSISGAYTTTNNVNVQNSYSAFATQGNSQTATKNSSITSTQSKTIFSAVKNTIVNSYNKVQSFISKL